MKNKGTKKNVFAASGITAGALVIWDYVGNVSWCTWGGVLHRDCLHFFSGVEVVLIPILPLFLFSLLTYRMHDEVFRAWWNFARWIVPIIALATLLANMMPSNRGFFNMDALIYLLVLVPLYAVFILVSLWKIVRTYRELKRAK
jgi:small-conductance mechanosensitive channel